MDASDNKVKDKTDALDPLDFGVKKKKKKPIDLGEAQSARKKAKDVPDAVVSTTKTIQSSDNKIDELADKLDVELSFDLKKKKKSKKVELQEIEALANEPVGDVVSKENEPPVFTYEMLLSRVFALLGAQNPDFISDHKPVLTMAHPQVARVGTRKSVFLNFAAIAAQLNRDQSHLAAYVFAELGTQGSVDSNNALLIRGRYQSKHLEHVLRNYCRTYVLCCTCQSSETDLFKDSRLLFLKCRRCGSSSTVKTVTSGFRAIIGKRAAIRAKNQ